MAPKRNFAVLVASNQGGGDVEKACDEACWTLIKEFLLKEESSKGRWNIQVEQLKKLLEHVRNGQIDIDQAVEELSKLPFEDLGFACINHHRQIRRGFPELI